MLEFYEAQDALQQAQKHWQNREWQLTIQACAKALTCDRQLAEAHKLMGDALQKTGKVKEAVGYYEQAIVIQPDFAKVYVNLGSLFANQQQWQKAIHYYQQALTIDPQLLAVHEHLARILVLQQQQPEKQAETVVESSSSILEDCLKRGKQLKEIGNLSEALPEFERAAKIAPYRIDIYQEIVNLNERLGFWQEAAKYCRVILQLSAANPALQQHIMPVSVVERSPVVKTLPPQNPQIATVDCLTAARDAIASKQYRLAINYYEKAIDRQPDCMEAYLGWANLLTRRGKFGDAIALYLQALKEVRDNPEIYFHLGNVYRLESKESQAAVCYQKAIQYAPNYAKAHHELAEVLSKKEQWSSAIASYRQAISYDPDFSWSYNNLGYALIQVGEWQEAIPIYEKAIELNPDFSWSYYNLAEAYCMVEEWTQAVDLYERAKEIDPSLPKIEQKLGNALYRRSHEDLDDALSHFLQAIEQDPEDLLAYHQAISIDKTNSDLYLRLVDSLIERGQTDEAIVTYQMDLKFNTKDSRLKMQLQSSLEKKTTLSI